MAIEHIAISATWEALQTTRMARQGLGGIAERLELPRPCWRIEAGFMKWSVYFTLHRVRRVGRKSFNAASAAYRRGVDLEIKSSAPDTLA